MKLGTINGAFRTHILDKENKCIGNCIDTPNNAAFVFATIPEAQIVNNFFGADYLRESEDMQSRMKWIKSDATYHSQFIVRF